MAAITPTSPIQISHNCKQIAVTIPMIGQPPGQYTLELSYGATTTTVPIILNQGQSQIFYIADIETSGVVVATVKNAQGLVLVQEASVATCQIDCCIAKLVESAINCTCKCDKCKEELDRAEKIFLLLQSAVYAAEVAENIQDAKDKYAKASELCTEVCACGC